MFDFVKYPVSFGLNRPILNVKEISKVVWKSIQLEFKMPQNYWTHECVINPFGLTWKFSV